MIVVSNLSELKEALRPYENQKVAGAFSQTSSQCHPGFVEIVRKCNELGDATVCVYHSLTDLVNLLSLPLNEYHKEPNYKEELLEFWEQSSIKPDIMYFEDTDDFILHCLGGLSLSEVFVESNKVWEMASEKYEMPNGQEFLSRAICLYTGVNRKQNGVNLLYHMDLMVMSYKEGYRRFISKRFNEHYGYEYVIIDPVLDEDGLPYSTHKNIACSDEENKFLGGVSAEMNKVDVSLNKIDPEKYKADLIEVIEKVDSSFVVSFLGVYDLAENDIFIEARIKITGEGNEKGPMVLTKWIKEVKKHEK